MIRCRRRSPDDLALERAVRAIRRAYAKRYPISTGAGRQFLACAIAALNSEFRPSPQPIEQERETA